MTSLPSDLTELLQCCHDAVADILDTTTVLAERARALAELLQQLSPRVEELRRDHAESARVVLVGKTVADLTHDLNNALNNILLQTSVVQLRVDDKGRDDLEAIRKHGTEAAELVRVLQQFVQERPRQS